MAWIRTNASVDTTDFLGRDDSYYTFQGDEHRHVAQKFLSEIKGSKRKQLLLFYGEAGMGKTRLAKETARELASIVNEGLGEPMLFLFLIDCEKYGKVEGPGVSHLQSDVAQALAAVDKELARLLAGAETHNFYARLSSYLGANKRVFLFLIDGIAANIDAVQSFMVKLVQHNENILIVATSSEHLTFVRMSHKASAHSCTGLTLGAATALLREAADHVAGLSGYEEELVTLCHLNPFLVMRTGQQMNADDDDDTKYTPREMIELFEHSLMLAVSGGNVPEKDDPFRRELELANSLTESISLNLVAVVDQPSSGFTSAELVKDLDKEESPAVVKKSYLAQLASHSILSQENGFYSLSDVFKGFFNEQRLLLNQSKDEFVEKIYNELKATLSNTLSTRGMEMMFMIHKNEVSKVLDLERWITRVKPSNYSQRYLHQVQFIKACTTFLKNIPLSASQVSEFSERTSVILNRARANEKPVGEASKNGAYDLRKDLSQLGIGKRRGDVDGHDPDRSDGPDDQTAGGRFKRDVPKGPPPGDVDRAAGDRRPVQRDPDNYFMAQSQERGMLGKRNPPRDDESLRGRFGIEVFSQRSAMPMSRFSSLISTDDSLRGRASVEVGELTTKALSPPPKYPLSECTNGPEGELNVHPSQPQEDSYHGDLSSANPLEEKGPEEQSFDAWQCPSDTPEDWSMYVNPP